MGAAYTYCKKIIAHFSSSNTIALHPTTLCHKKLSTDYLFGEARGKMFGVLECRNKDGTTIFLHAFSGQYNGLWQVNGWVPPLFEIDEFHTTQDETERIIKALGKELDALTPQSDLWLKIKKERREMSRSLMRKIHGIYRLHNFKNQQASLFEATKNTNKLPTGTGDCCAPKLLNFAARKQLIPVSLAEFYWGKTNRSQSKRHGFFYPSCQEKCSPILGFLLCGVEKQYA